MNIDDTLAERQKTHGSFRVHAAIAQSLKDCIREHPGWASLNTSQREALEMVCHKIARMLSGNPNEIDHWHDCIGYCRLVEVELNEGL